MAIPFSATEIIDTLGKELIKEVNLVAGSVLEEVVPRTPVRTGHARRNWQTNIGTSNSQELPGVDPSGRATVQNGKTKLKASVKRNPFLPVFIENNTSYIGRLNAGSSRQAPAMFVELAIATAVRKRQNARVVI